MKALPYLVGSILLPALVATAAAQGYPAKPVRILSPFPAGSPLDTLLRKTGQEMQAGLRQPVIVEPRPGAYSITMAEACAKSAPDGYTLCLFSRSTPMLPYLFKKLPFDMERDFEPVTNMVYTTLGLVVHPSVQATNVQELITAARANPNLFNYASLGPSTTAYMFMEWLNKQHGLTITHIPYKGPPELMRALLSGESHVTFLGLGAFPRHHEAGKLRIIAVNGDQRSPLVPAIATLREQGFTAIETRVWFGLFAPAGISRDHANRIYRELAKVFSDDAFREKNLIAQAFEPVGSSPEDFARFLKSDNLKSAELIRITGARVD